MSGNGIVVEFPSGRRLGKVPPIVDRSIAHLVRSLSRKRRSAAKPISTDHSLVIRLDMLTGVDDETVAGLASLAAQRIITPSSAVRLALRHAAEAIRPRTELPVTSADPVPHPTIAMTLSGDVFGDFAFRLRMGDVWIGFTSASHYGSLFEICPPDRGAICLLIGCDASRRNTVRFLTSNEWRSCLSARMPIYAGSVHHILVLGGIPPAGEARSSVLSDLACAVRRSGGNILTGAVRWRRATPDRHRVPTRIGLGLLTLIELAMPGLVGFDGRTEEARR